MKWWHWLIIGIVALWWWRRRANTVTRPLGGSMGEATRVSDPGAISAYRPGQDRPLTAEQEAVRVVAVQNFPGGAGDPSKIELADQSLYPGWYRTDTGGWVRPSTGEFISPGGSPSTEREVNEYVLGLAERPTYEIMPELLSDRPGTLDSTGYVVY
jgi:hypothetical protein